MRYVCGKVVWVGLAISVNALHCTYAEMQVQEVGFLGEDEKMYVVIENVRPCSAATDRTGLAISRKEVLVSFLGRRCTETNERTIHTPVNMSLLVGPFR